MDRSNIQSFFPLLSILSILYIHVNSLFFLKMKRGILTWMDRMNRIGRSEEEKCRLKFIDVKRGKHA
jgi:hypothetical protein